MPDQQSRLVPLIMRFVLLTSVVGLLALWSLNRSPQDSINARYVGDTGHNIYDAFLAFYDQNGDLGVFGYPITEQFTHEGKTIQYFQNVRMELVPDGSVRLSPIAIQMGKDQPSIPPPDSASQPQRYFPETGHLIDERFYDYFSTHGGIRVFGYPIAEVTTEADRVVQYFQNVKMEWHPELPDQQVSLSVLGEAHFYWAGLDPSLLKSVPAAISIDPITTLAVDASVAQTHTTYPGTQTVTVFVTRLNTTTGRQPVPGARVHLSIQYPDIPTPQEFEMLPTDAQGRTAITFEVLPSPIREKIVVFVTGEAGGETRQTELSFIRWP